MNIQRPRGLFTLVPTKTSRVSSEASEIIKQLQEKLKSVTSLEEEKILKDRIKYEREQGLREYLFLAEPDHTLDRLVEFLASTKQDTDNYNAWDEIQDIVISHLKTKFQQSYWNENDQVDLDSFKKTLENPTFSGRVETPSSINNQIAKAIREGRMSDVPQLLLKMNQMFQ